MSEPDKKGSLFERIAHGYFYGDENHEYIQNDFKHQINEGQKQSVRKIKIRTFIFSAIAGMCGVLALYLPPYYSPETFQVWSFELNIGTTISVSVFYWLFVLFLTAVEIYFLVYLNIRAVGKIARACDFPPKQDPNFELHFESLVKRNKDQHAKNEKSIGLNQWQGYSKFTVITTFLWTMLRATITNFIIKIIIYEIVGSSIPYLFIDLIGIPVMAYWNIWAANKVLNESQARILAPGIIQQTVIYLYNKYSQNNQFKNIIYDTLQFLAIRKRSFHANHYILSVNLLKTFEIPFKQVHHVPDNFIQTLKHLPDEMHNDIAHLIVVGMIVDGHLSHLEKESLDELVKLGIVDYSSREIKEMMKEFLEGGGKQVLDLKLKMVVANY